MNKKNILLIFLLVVLYFIFKNQKYKEKFSNKNKKLNCIYMWGMKKNETQPIPTECINKNKIYVDHKIIGYNEIYNLVKKYPNPNFIKIWSNIPKWIIQADLGRLLYIYYNGGFYFDVDCEIKKDIKPLINSKNFNNMNKNTVLFTEFMLKSTNNLGKREKKNDKYKHRIANYGFGSKIKKNNFYKKCIDECIRRLQILYKENKNTKLEQGDILWVCGPDVITNIYHDNKKDDIILLEKNVLINKNFGSWH